MPRRLPGATGNNRKRLGQIITIRLTELAAQFRFIPGMRGPEAHKPAPLACNGLVDSILPQGLRSGAACSAPFLQAMK